MVYTFPTYVVGIAIGVAVVSALVGCVLLFMQVWRFTFVAFLIAGLAGGLIAPALAMDRVVLDDQKLEQTTGFWFSPTVKGFRLAEVKAIQIDTARDRKGRQYQVWIVTKKNGNTEEIDPGDLWENNSDDIVKRLREKGIIVR